jgi:hypothetical protein
VRGFLSSILTPVYQHCYSQLPPETLRFTIQPIEKQARLSLAVFGCFYAILRVKCMRMFQICSNSSQNRGLHFNLPQKLADLGSMIVVENPLFDTVICIFCIAALRHE